ncbi:Protein of uncharacterised function (DUF2846) [Pseudomonas aeruginosa]|nr:Protein of uncharacterised function (DUF2846) [Pseudomonas aeruginosa]
MLRSLSLALSIVASLVGCSTPGAFFGALDGPVFATHPAADASHATVYLYRPQSQWADEELEAPGIFLNNELIGSLPSNGYLAFEFETGSYKLEMRRPLAGSFWTLFADGPMDFTRIASFVLDARAGAVYYLRYDELAPPPKSEHPAGEGDGPLQLVGRRPRQRRDRCHPPGPGTHAVRRQRLPEAHPAFVLGRRRADTGQDRHLSPARL